MARQCVVSSCGACRSTKWDTSQISPKATATNISTRNAEPRVATVIAASTSDKCMAHLAVPAKPHVRNSHRLIWFRFRMEFSVETFLDAPPRRQPLGLACCRVATVGRDCVRILPKPVAQHRDLLNSSVCDCEQPFPWNAMVSCSVFNAT